MFFYMNLLKYGGIYHTLRCVYIYRFSWSHNQAQMGNRVQLGFSIDITLRKYTKFRGADR